jgi:DNA-binding beta-propeller fold protein YncE
MKRNLYIAATFIVVLLALVLSQSYLERVAEAQSRATVQAPRFEVDPLWPKALPNNWAIGSSIGVSVDAQDHVWMIHRPDTLLANETAAAGDSPTASCCKPAPPVLEFDPAGNLVNSWGGPGQGYEWPQSNHGITVDYKENVWIGGNGTTVDNQILKFTKQGKFLMQIGKSRMSQGSNDTANLKGAAKLFIDKVSNEVYVADGYGNKRVIVFDADTGAYKRHWGAYGNKPDDTSLGAYNPDAPPAQQFRSPVHCAELSNDRFLYVCDRPNDRIQVFTPEGKFVKEQIVAKRTLGDGSVWDIVFSKDPEQKYLFLADGKNEKIYVILRETLEILYSFGDGGRQPGQFFAVHSIASDSKGNLYTTETYEGKRIQKFVYKGLANVTRGDLGTTWPASK